MRSRNPVGTILTLLNHWAIWLALAALTALAATGGALAQAPLTVTTGAGIVELRADTQRKEGNVYIAEGNVEIQYGDTKLTSDSAEYNTDTNEVTATGHVEFDYQNAQIFGDSAEYNIKTGQGQFHHVHGLLHIMREPNGSVLVTQNPLYFTATLVERLDNHTYRIHDSLMTVCDPMRPTWTFNSKQATLHVNQTVALLDANFRLYRIPLLWLPYATLPAQRKLRQSGFMMPEFGHSTIEGDVLGDAYYWAPSYWTDATVGVQIMTARGASETGQLRMRPAENVNITANYFGVVDEGLPGPNGVRVPQGGHTFHIGFDAELKHGWRAVTNINELSSLTFQLVFSPTFNEAVNSEISSTGFLTNNFRGYSINFSANDYKDFLTASTPTTPQTSLELRSAPEVWFSSQDRPAWQNLPFYFGFDTFQDSIARSDPLLNTPAFVSRSEFAPRVTVPLHWKTWLGVTSTFSFLAQRYGAQVVNESVVDTPIWRAVGELSVDFELPTLERVWTRPASKWKHTIEPEIIYNYVNGMNNFSNFIRVDENDPIADTNEVQYQVTQRLYRSTGEEGAQELVSWTLYQKYYFDPTFGGAILPGQPNIFQALDSVTPFAFALGPVNFSPLVSDIRYTPGGVYDFEFRTDYDPQLRRISTVETLLKLHPKQNWEFTTAYYSIDVNELLQPVSNQIRLLASYGGLNQRGWGASAGVSYDFDEKIVENELFTVNYNGSCCGVAIGFQRLSLGDFRVEDQFRASFVIANIGEFGNLRKLEKVF